LFHKKEVDDYVAKRDQEAEEIRQRFEAKRTLPPFTRELLEKRLRDRKGASV